MNEERRTINEELNILVMKTTHFLLTLILLGSMAGCTGEQSKKATSRSDDDRPNVIIIYCDDLGYGDLGCFGAEDIATPNIDHMAEAGIRFTEFYSASPVCSPSRAALLTGRMPQRMGINGVFFPESYTGMPLKEITIASLLKEEGYATGIVGKWHLGHLKKFLPLQRGFDEYFGIPYSNDMESVVYLRGNEVVDFHVDQSLTTKTYTEEAVAFIKNHKEEPFFLYLAHNMPHVPIYASEDFLGTSERGLYGDVVQEIDWSVGQVITTLQNLQLLDNRFIESDFLETHGIRMRLRVIGINTVDLGRFQHHIDIHFHSSQRGRRISREEWITGAGSKDHHSLLFEITHGSAADIGLGDLLDSQCREHAAAQFEAPHRILQGQRIHEGISRSFHWPDRGHPDSPHRRYLQSFDSALQP